MRTALESIDAYMAQINDIPRIDRKEEERLSRLSRDAATSMAERAGARNTLICANLRLVVKIAHDFKFCGVSFADLVSEGNRGLMIAVDKFDPDNGAKFSVYAAWWIKQFIRKAIQKQARTIRVPGTMAQRSMRLCRAREAFLSENGRAPTMGELTEITGLGECTIKILDTAVMSTVSMHETVSEDSDASYEDVLAACEDDYEAAREPRAQLEAALTQLSELDRYIVDSLYGLYGHPVGRMTVAQETGLSEDAVQTRLDSALARMRSIISNG